MATQRKPWRIPELWKGETIFIIGGGPSLKEVNLDCLRTERTIGTNHAFRDYPWVDLLYFGDCQFYDKLATEPLKKWAGLKVTSCARVPELGKGWPGIRRIGRSKPYGIESNKRGFIAWNGNTGGSAINIAYWLGAHRIVLLGFDMHPADGSHNWHSYYDERKADYNPYKIHMRGWPLIAKDAKELGIEIINATPDSAIQDFKHIPLEKLI